jgi:tRNA pseudouridine55 synthase
VILKKSAKPGKSMKGILLVDKTRASTSFHIVSLLRRLTGVETIGHAGTLDPFATGVMVFLISREYTRRSNEFLTSDKQYRATLHLGISTDTYDLDGQVTHQSPLIPTPHDIELALAPFQGDILQIPPMYSAKKVQGKKLYDLARRGITIERQPVPVHLDIRLIRFEYPHLELLVDCSKGTYIRSLAHDLGQILGCGAHLIALCRTRSGHFTLEECLSQTLLKNPDFDLTPHLRLS